ncbi:MAG: sporulation transcriptional regulator SpoIIID [Bacilli bacterium]|jgi:putative DeoR family transcriptional regulator (stage III sporulation protein D)
MHKNIKERVLDEAIYILKTNDTIRDIAKVFGVSKSTVHKDLHERLKEINIKLFYQVDRILKYHLDVRHIRGGQSTKLKYLNLAK